MSEIALPAPGTRPGAQSVFALAALAALELLVFVIGLAMGASGWEIAVLLLALATAFVGALPVILDLGRPPERRQMLISLTSLVYMIYLVLPPFTQYFMLKGEHLPGLFRLNQSHPADIAHAQAVALLGLIGLLVGFYTPFGRFAVQLVPRPVREWSPQAALTISVITLGLGWIFYPAAQLGLIPGRAGSGIFGTLANGSFFGISLLTLTWLRHQRREAVLLLLLVIPLAMMFNFLSGSKRLFLTPPFMVALAYIVYERRIRKNWVIAGLLALIVLYPVSNFYRATLWVGNNSRTAEFFKSPGRVLRDLATYAGSADMSTYLSSGLQATGTRLDALGVLTVIVKDTPERVPYQGGWTIGLIAVSFVPRLLWPGKPGITIGEWVSQTYGSPYDLYTDVGPTWVGEFFFNWGYAGVFLGMLVIGIVCRMLQERVFDRNAPIPALFVAIGVLYYITRGIQSGLISPVSGVVYTVAPIVIAHVLVGLFGGYQHLATRSPPLPAPGTSPLQG